ncbi:MAG: GvpL/GvpF family gas vesicle protein [Acidobacteria bacterium]|nr:GvpL/GvpF family gas vesicle protein [Acidobacteriota bacterium]
MPLLLYAVIEGGEPGPELPSGVAGVTIQSMKASGLRCFYAAHRILSGFDPRETALEFHRVVQAIFRAADVIPFRFPTLLADETQLRSELQTRAAKYHEDLARVRGRVQMEIRIEFSNGGRDEARAKLSGAEYLRTRQSRQATLECVAAMLNRAVCGLLADWRQHELRDQLRCFALVGRTSVTEFERVLASAKIGPELRARISGPWPATAFFSEERENPPCAPMS